MSDGYSYLSDIYSDLSDKLNYTIYDNIYTITVYLNITDFMKRYVSSQKAHGKKNRSFTIGDMVDLKSILYRRGHTRKILHITMDVNRKELISLLEKPYDERSSDRVKELKDSNTYIDKVLKIDSIFNKGIL